MSHARTGARISGWGTSEQPCLAMSRPVRLTYDVSNLEGAPPEFPPLIKYQFEGRWIATWLFPRQLVERGYLDQAFCDPVILAIEGHEERGDVVAAMYAIRYLKDEPEWIDLGPVVRLEESRRYRGDPRGEIADVLLCRLQGDPAREVKNLLETV